MRILFLLFVIWLAFTSCSFFEEDDKDDEPFKSMYDDKSQMILMPLSVGYRWIFENTKYGEGTYTELDTMEILEKRDVAGITIYVTEIDDDEIEGIALVGDTLHLNVKVYNGMVEYGDLSFYLNTSLRDAYDLHNGSATYSHDGYTYELTGAVDEHIVNLLSGTVLVSGTTYTVTDMYQSIVYKFADWRNNIDTFFGPVEFTWYDSNGNKQFELKLVDFKHPF